MEVAASDANQPKSVGPGPNSMALFGWRSPGRRPRLPANPRLTSAWNVGLAGDHGVDAPVRQRPPLPESRRSPCRSRAEICPRRLCTHPRGNAQTPRAYWPPDRCASGNQPDSARPRFARGKTHRTASRSIESSRVRSCATIASIRWPRPARSNAIASRSAGSLSRMKCPRM